MMTKGEGTLKCIKTALVLPKGSNLGLLQSVDSAANLQKTEKKTEERVEWHQEQQISKGQAGTLNRLSSPSSLIKCKTLKGIEVIPINSKRLKGHQVC